MEKPLVSLVITAKNEEKNVRNCLESIKNQSYRQENLEIIVVDNNSTDKTKKIAREYTENVFNKGPERSAQRNFGMLEKAGGKYVMFLDADMSLSEGVIEACVEKMEQDPKLVGLYISEIVTGKGFWTKVRRFERGFYDGTVIDGLRFLKRETFTQIGGFDERMYACEDWDLTKRIKKLGKVALTTTPIYHHEGNFKITDYLGKKDYYCKNLDIYREKWGQDDLDAQKQFGFWYRFFGVFVEKEKWVRLLTHPILTCGMYFLRCVVGFRFLRRRQYVDNN